MDIITEETPGQGRQRGGRDTRQRLIEAALEVFAERGYHAASLSEIASRAGLTTGAVYSTFGSKKALLVAAVIQSSADSGGDVGSVLAGAPSLREGLERMVLDSARTGLNAAALRLVKLQMEVLKLGLSEPEVLAAVAEGGRQQLDAVEKLVTELARRDGVELPMPARDLVILVSAMLNGLELLQLVDPSVVSERLFLEGLHALLGTAATKPKRR